MPKPHLQLTDWWRRILAQIERRQNEFWTEIAYVVLSVALEDQKKFESNFEQLANKVRRAVAPITETPELSCGAVLKHRSNTA